MSVAFDRDVFLRFMAERVPREIALLAFASYAASRFDWEAHFQQVHGHVPGGEDVDRWISDHSDLRLNEMLKSAGKYFTDLANDYQVDRIAAEREEALTSAMLAQIKACRSKLDSIGGLRATFWPGVVSGVVASFVFSFVVIAASMIFERDPSPFAFLKAAVNAPAPVAAPDKMH